jgi:hypothetical protein
MGNTITDKYMNPVKKLELLLMSKASLKLCEDRTNKNVNGVKMTIFIASKTMCGDSYTIQYLSHQRKYLATVTPYTIYRIIPYLSHHRQCLVTVTPYTIYRIIDNI